MLAQTKEYAVKDYNTIGEYARSQGFEGEVMPWDMAYYSEKYRHEKYELNEELVKPYLQLDSVKRGYSCLPISSTALISRRIPKSRSIIPR